MQQALVVGRGDDQGAAVVGVERLQDGVDDPAELAMLRRVLTLLAQGVELVEERNHGGCGHEVEHLAEVGGGLAEEGRHHAVGANDGKGPPELARDDLGGERLAAPGRTAEEQAVARPQAMGSQHLFAIVLVEDFLHGR